MDVLLSDSDWDSYSETGSNEDQEGNYHFYGEHASSLFSSLEASIGKIDDFLSFERGFIYGDIVCSVRDPSGQMGKVVGIKISVDLESVNGNVIKDVNSKNLSKIRPFSVGDFVVCGPWLGRVDRVVDCIAIVFDDGTECVVTAVDPEKLIPVSPNILEDPQYPYYPGQRVQVRLSTVSKSTKWLCGNWSENQDEGTVCSLEGGLVYVDWLASVLVGCDSDYPAPPRQLDSKKLTLVSCFSHANWQLGDWCMLSIAECKGFSEQAFHRTSTCELTNKQEGSERGFKRRNPKSKIEEIFVISKTKTKVDVVWQDGSQSLEVDSQTLLPVSVVNDHEFWPEQFVLEKGAYDDLNLFSSQRWGVVRGVDAKERTVKVQWKTIIAPGANDLEGEQMEEEVVSAYELVEHPDYSYCFGDYVFRMVQNHFDEEVDKSYSSTRLDMTEEVAPEEKNFGGDQEPFTDKSYLRCIGNVLDFKNGVVEVRWATGITSKVAPCEIFRFDKHEISTEITVEDASEELNKEKAEHEKQPNNEKAKDSFNLNGDAKSCKQYASESSSYSLPQAAFGFISSIAMSLFGSHGYTSLLGPSPSSCTKESGICHEKRIEETRDICTEPHMVCESDDINENSNHEGNDIEGNIYLLCLKDQEKVDHFRQFDMLDDCADHHFHGSSKELALSQVKRGWMKKVQQEWNILEKDLPEQIYVRAFEERMDLLRAAIVGAPGTPYHDGLFFFDIYLPPEYPHDPPTVHYISGGLRVNPNLYESGKVCLSLLNTWTGTGSEVWNPESSTILQVLLSLQALVLNDRPYFNEAGYDQQVGRIEGEKNSVSYNENAFLMTCKCMLYSLQKPPKHFEGLVMEHFTRRSENILTACKAYMEGVPIGGVADFQKTNGSSTGFKIMLAKLFQKLVEAFSAKGIDCNQFLVAGK
ncbi:probable ubiquitin-conjugating enzyme E2 24 [Argentina anserina]|uniref:probable ubiquitin-conjugating enzyme E2 24 n=1 Tax=Argentina anserina TaxID=57926 RepID=UPI00217646C2|nr:probable ubiquitin-conjugating enzyme E2 24 [Potentilla anserina]